MNRSTALLSGVTSRIPQSAELSYYAGAFPSAPQARPLTGATSLGMGYQRPLSTRRPAILGELPDPVMYSAPDLMPRTGTYLRPELLERPRPNPLIPGFTSIHPDYGLRLPPARAPSPPRYRDRIDDLELRRLAPPPTYPLISARAPERSSVSELEMRMRRLEAEIDARKEAESILAESSRAIREELERRRSPPPRPLYERHRERFASPRYEGRYRARSRSRSPHRTVTSRYRDYTPPHVPERRRASPSPPPRRFERDSPNIIRPLIDDGITPSRREVFVREDDPEDSARPPVKARLGALPVQSRIGISTKSRLGAVKVPVESRLGKVATPAKARLGEPLVPLDERLRMKPAEPIQPARGPRVRRRVRNRAGKAQNLHSAKLSKTAEQSTEADLTAFKGGDNVPAESGAESAELLAATADYNHQMLLNVSGLSE